MPRTLTVACDKCGEGIRVQATRPIVILSGSKHVRRAGEYDLCEPCLKQFRDWLGAVAVSDYEDEPVE